MHFPYVDSLYLLQPWICVDTFFLCSFWEWVTHLKLKGDGVSLTSCDLNPKRRNFLLCILHTSRPGPSNPPLHSKEPAGSKAPNGTSALLEVSFKLLDRERILHLLRMWTRLRAARMAQPSSVCGGFVKRDEILVLLQLNGHAQQTYTYSVSMMAKSPMG